MTTGWREACQAAGADSKVLDVLQGVAQTHGLHECARGGGGEVGLGAAPDAYAAVYVGRRGMTIALEPEDAAKVGSAHDLSLIAKTPRTHYVRVPQHRLTEVGVGAAVKAALDRAVQRSWQGPRWRRGAGMEAPRRHSCLPVQSTDTSSQL